MEGQLYGCRSWVAIRIRTCLKVNKRYRLACVGITIPDVTPVNCQLEVGVGGMGLHCCFAFFEVFGGFVFLCFRIGQELELELEFGLGAGFQFRFGLLITCHNICTQNTCRIRIYGKTLQVRATGRCQIHRRSS